MKNCSFPVMLDHDFRSRTVRSMRNHGAFLSCIGVPREMLAEHTEQVHLNHGKSLDVLARMGGLSADECLAILENRAWMPMDEVDAQANLVRAVLAWQSRRRFF